MRGSAEVAVRIAEDPPRTFRILLVDGEPREVYDSPADFGYPVGPDGTFLDWRSVPFRVLVLAEWFGGLDGTRRPRVTVRESREVLVGEALVPDPEPAAEVLL